MDFRENVQLFDFSNIFNILWVIYFFNLICYVGADIIWSDLCYNYEKFIIQERLKYYPDLFKITQDIWKKNRLVEENLKLIQKAKKEFLDWRGKWTWYMLLSKKSLECFNKLKESLKTNPWNWEKWYTDEQLEKIYKQRNNLRWSLKDDVWISIDNYKD